MRVFVERVESYRDAGKFVEKAFELFNPEFKYLKPNFLKFDNPKNGCITHPDLIKAIINVARECGMEDLKVIEGGFYRDSAEKCFVEFGLKEVAECVNLNVDEFVDVEIGGEALKSVKVAKTALKARGSYLTVPKLKVHHLTKATLGIKNNMGFLKKPAIYMHRNIHQKLVDLLSFFQPSFVIIDGIIGGTNSEMRPKPVKHKVLIASDNVIAADIVGAKLMGFSPSEIQHLMLAMQMFGISELDVEIVANPGIEKLVKHYSLSLSSRMLGRLGI